jgi:class 3 adenylate cyclase/tetratricopeptide (TPR) repeat protein
MNCIQCGDPLPGGARFCPVCGGKVTAAPAPDERKLVTVIFCDLVGSTALSEVLDPETLRSVILRYFAAMSAQVTEYGGIVEKFIGDAVMAVFGVPAMHDDDARRACEAALGMLAALSALNADLESALGVRLRVRIGVHTGLAVTSTDVAARQAMVSGETVNVAARLEQNAVADEILIGPVTREALGAAARCEDAGPLRLKGKEAPVTAYRLLAVGEDTPEAIRRFDVPFTGRRPQLAALDRALEAAAHGGPLVVTICGEPGIGKTRLLRTWTDGHRDQLRHGGGRCRPYRDHGSLASLAEAARALLAESGARASCDPEALAVLDAGLLPDGTPGPSLQATCAALARVLGALSADRPIVASVDDCQWAGDVLLDALARLADAAGPRVMLICVSRASLLDRWPAGSRVRPQVLDVPRLSAAECGELAGALTDVAAHSADAGAAIFDITGGNPFHVEQLAAAASDGQPRQLPPGLQALLGARIDALQAADRNVLDLAAVLGREFLPGLVSAIAEAWPEGQPEGPLTGRVAASFGELRQRRLVEYADGSDPGQAARFSSGLVHEATYQAMTKQTRADRHERAANVLTIRQVDDATIAEHLEHAYRYRCALGLRDDHSEALRAQAAALLAALGHQALNRSDLEWARSLLSRARSLYTTGEPGWIVTTRRLGEAALASGGAEEGTELLRSVLRRLPDPVEGAYARLALAVAGVPEAPGAEPSPAARVAREVLPVFQSAASNLGLARATIRLAQEQQMLGRHADAVRMLDLGMRHAVAAGAEQERALALGTLGISLWRGQDPVPEAIVRGRELLVEHGSSRPTVRLTLNCPLALLLALDEQPEMARASLDIAARAASELAFAEAGVVIPMFRGAVESAAGHPGQALELLNQAAGEACRIGAAGLHGAIVRESARLLLDQGRLADAQAHLSLAGPTDDLLRSDQADLLGMRGRLAAAGGDAGTALSLTAAALEAAADTDSPLVASTAQTDRAAVLLMVGQPGRAAESAAAARRQCEKKGDRVGTRRAATLYGQALMAMPNADTLSGTTAKEGL